MMRWVNRFLVVGLCAAGLVAGQASAQSGRAGDLRIPDQLREGDLAPDFTLKSPDGKREVTLSQFRGKKPVALVFGSYT